MARNLLQSVLWPLVLRVCDKETYCLRLNRNEFKISLFSVLLRRLADSRASSVYVYTLNTLRLDI